ncbi:phenylalanine--tRNA ligase subunit beta [Pseudolysinimonas sp.]|uniref:phenylalanine--tRNA ligase subunit beta n=1 Tax=Pseudolysinimonas sp. TaxID=2680009 RepID=UPI00286C3EAE|nr:phenylalanine--tRNA ligase subunit beta [Pseudolysinimonas sp.]
MRIPISWLGEWVDLPPEVTLEHLHAALVKVGFEEEDVHGFDVQGPVVVGRVLSFEDEPQSNGKTIRWVQVDVGEGNPRGIVCGAHNFEVGDLVPVSLPGAVLPGPFPITARTTYGHVSDGMIASERELGLGDEHSGIMRLHERGLVGQPGDDAIALLGLDDAAVEINVTPDRGYALSIRGLAREYSHSTGAAFRDPALEPVVGEATGYSVIVNDATPIRGRVGCDAFAARVVRGVDATRPTPSGMIARLKLAGIRSISLPVDISNYVMLELGQPTHTYDLGKLAGGIVVRRAAAGEQLETLDGQVRKLDVEDLLITDESGPIGLAGVMGGLATEVSDATTDILVEAAHFDPVTIARAARRHKLWSEASKRFERGVDPTLGPIAAQRVADLLVQLAGGTIDPLGVVVPYLGQPVPIAFAPGDAAALIGVDYTDDEVRDALTLIGATVDVTVDRWTVTPPPWRPDLVDSPSLIEEVARITGYDRIPSQLPTAPPGRGWTREQVARRRLAQTLAAAGLTEVLAYPFQSAATIERFEPAASAVQLANALDPQAPFLRRSLLPGLLETARRNLSRGLTDLAIFEIGTVFRPDPGVAYGTVELPPGAVELAPDVLDALTTGLPPQPSRVAVLFLGDVVAKQPGAAAIPAGLADALDAVSDVGLALAADIRRFTGSHPALHPGRTAELRVGDTVVGIAGELLPSLARELDLPGVVAVAELDLDALLTLGATEIAARPIGTLPAATQDLSLVVPAETPAADVRDAVIEGAGELLEDARLVDDYRGAGVPEGSKSLTFALRFRAADRTLTAAEATEAKLAGVALAASRLGATLRD